MSKRVVMWFRRDLRLADNPALSFAAEQGSLVPVYIIDTVNSGDEKTGEASQWWLYHSLKSLNKSLANKLIVLRGNPEQLLDKLCEELGATTVVWNRCYEPWQMARDTKIKTHLQHKGIDAKSFNASLMWEPWQVLKQDKTPYKVFTPYYKRGCMQSHPPRFPTAAPKKFSYARVGDLGLEIESLGLLPEVPWYQSFEQHWSPGEEGAAQQLHTFLPEGVEDYQEQRDLPAVSATSGLSPYLHFGELSPNQIWYAVKGSFGDEMGSEVYESFLRQLVWREFSYYLLFHFPDFPTKNFQPKFDKFAWGKDARALSAWQQGRTGIPIVDAGMRELWQTGYMHNRVRMLVGSFLVKNLLIDWREGAKWFWDCLLDADLANNSAGWQWVAGSGADAAPYFRIFNPVTQGEKFDKEGEYVRRYCPELAQIPSKFIHKPWEASSQVLSEAKVELGKDYPKPIVDLKYSRQRALDEFAKLKEGGTS